MVSPVIGSVLLLQHTAHPVICIQAAVLTSWGVSVHSCSLIAALQVTIERGRNCVSKGVLRLTTCAATYRAVIITALMLSCCQLTAHARSGVALILADTVHPDSC